jgi:uncharacterized protein DUF1552
MPQSNNRRDFLAKVGLGAAAANLALHLPSFAITDPESRPAKKRIVFVFSPNGVVPKHFWPRQSSPGGAGADFELPRILQPLAEFKNRMLTLNGICNKIKGDGDGHMRGIGCLLTGIELFPGDVQGGSDTPAGWSRGISVDRHLRNKLQADPTTRTRFGSLEFGVMVPDRADTWTRMSYAGPNQPVAPIDDPYRMFDKLYGTSKNRQLLASVLDDLTEDLHTIEQRVSTEDRPLLQDHLTMIREVEKELQADLANQGRESGPRHALPSLPSNVPKQNDNMPKLCQMQIELLAQSFAADFARVATVQITNSVGNATMRWLGIDQGHHTLSHEPDSNEQAYEKLIQINTWYCAQIAHLARRLDAIPEPGGQGSLLDHTTIVWTNELGKGNSHTRDNIPFVLVGGGLGWQMGRALDFPKVPHNRLLMSFCAAMGHPEPTFGNPDFCAAGPLPGLEG